MSGKWGNRYVLGGGLRKIFLYGFPTFNVSSLPAEFIFYFMVSSS